MQFDVQDLCKTEGQYLYFKGPQLVKGLRVIYTREGLLVSTTLSGRKEVLRVELVAPW